MRNVYLGGLADVVVVDVLIKMRNVHLGGLADIVVDVRMIMRRNVLMMMIMMNVFTWVVWPMLLMF